MTRTHHPAAAPAPTEYRADIDGMRAIAIALVVIFHFDLLQIGKAGFIGVDIFFVISGFLITRIILTGLAQDRFVLGRFYLARIRRLYPALTVTLAAYLLAGYFLFLPDKFAELGRETVLSQVYLINFYLWKTVNYFGLQADGVPLLHMWSLAVEEQFYILYPLFLMLLVRFFRAAVLRVLVVITLGSFALGWLATGWKPEAAFYLLPTRAWELSAGGVLAAWLMHNRPSRRIARIAGPLGLGMIVLALVLHNPLIGFPGWFAALPVAGAALLILGGARPGTPTPTARVLALPPMVFLGAISYPLYLVHWPISILIQDSVADYDYLWRLTGFSGSILAAWLIYHFVERPVRQRRILVRAPMFLGTAGGLSAAIVALGLLVADTGGLPQRFAPRVLDLLAFTTDKASQYERCDWPQPACPLGPRDTPARIAIIGDSNAQALAGAFDIWLNETNQPGRLLFASACAPVLQAGPPRCVTFVEQALSEVEATPSVKTVFLVSVWRQPYEDVGYAINNTYLRGEAATAGFSRQLLKTITRLQAAGREVVVLDPFYALPRSAPEALARAAIAGTQDNVGIALADHLAFFAPLLATLDVAATRGVRRISFIEDFCTAGICPAAQGGAPVFSDTIHIRFGLSARFAELLGQKMQRLTP